MGSAGKKPGKSVGSLMEQVKNKEARVRNMGKKLKPGERKIIRGGPYGTYGNYFLSDEELAKYRAMPPDEYWQNNPRPIRPAEFQAAQERQNKNGA